MRLDAFAVTIWSQLRHAADFDALNRYLAEASQRDEARRAGDRELTVGAGREIERAHLLALQMEGFELAEDSFCRVDAKGCVRARTNMYSTPLKPGVQCRVRVLPTKVEVFYHGRCVACHERCFLRRQQVFDLEHYLDVLERKPGAFAGSKPLAQWRESGRWTRAYDELWQQLQQRHGTTSGTRLMIELLQEGKRVGYERADAGDHPSLGLRDG